MSFNVRLYTNYQIQIPRFVVNNLDLRKGSYVEVYLWTGKRSIVYKARIGAYFRFTIPKKELYGERLKPGSIFEITLIKL
jgi:bifunctional DNA-binding transcriptional regulator/antitoxin component of YhaV-PrlF toxin-antitoxin module